MNKVLVDNDVLLKLSCYGLQAELGIFLSDRRAQAEVLSVAAFVLPRYLNQSQGIGSKGRARENLQSLLAVCRQIEPSEEEVAVATELEERAQLLGLQLDVGESQLVAVLISREDTLMITGDKRAIGAMGRLGLASEVPARVGCLEQLMLCFVVGERALQVRSAICQEPLVDKSLAICFSCLNSAVAIEAITEGLQSYIGAVRRVAHGVLADDTLGLALVT